MCTQCAGAREKKNKLDGCDSFVGEVAIPAKRSRQKQAIYTHTYCVYMCVCVIICIVLNDF